MSGEPGMTGREIQAEFPDFEVPTDIDGDGWWQSKPYETMDQARVRMDRIAGEIRRVFGDPGDSVALVMHNMSKLLLLERMFPDATWRREFVGQVYNTSVTRIGVQGDGCQLGYFNRVTHLPDDLVT
jgi:broad specificity phosphatase PhoE